MSRRPGRRAVVTLVLSVACFAPGLAADPPEGGFCDPGPLETPGDRPALHDPRQDPLARSPGGRIQIGSYTSVQVNVVEPGQQNIVGDAANEPSIAVNPLDPDNLVIGWRQFDNVASNFRQAGWAYSMDGGQSWTFQGAIDPGVFRSDPVLDADSAGNFFYQSLTGEFDVDVFKSTDGGQSWGPPVPSFGGDKNWIVVDRTGGLADGQIYGIWTKGEFTRSTDGGATFENPLTADLGPTWGTLAVGPDGEVYAAGRTTSVETFVVSRSDDASDPGRTPTFQGTVVDLEGSMNLGGSPNPGGLLGQANVWVDPSPGPTRGFVYVVASVTPDEGGDPLDVHFSRSIDGGLTWSPPVRINDDEAPNAWQWFAAHSVAPNGRIDVVWNDTRNTLQSHRSQLFYAYSWDAGLSWSENAVVSVVFDSHVGWPAQNKLGDYYTIRSGETGADVAYAATFNGEQDVYYVRVFPDCNHNAISDVTEIADDATPDCNGNRIPDECEVANCDGAGTVPDGARVPGVPLTLAKLADGRLRLSWTPSCVPGDGDYAVYEGTLGTFDSHAARFCTTDGLTSLGLLPADGDTYYLVVPAQSGTEGSYGTDGSGGPRSQGRLSCFPQIVQSCR